MHNSLVRNIIFILELSLKNNDEEAPVLNSTLNKKKLLNKKMGIIVYPIHKFTANLVDSKTLRKVVVR